MDKNTKAPNTSFRVLFIVLGFFFVTVGAIGIVLPLLPTTVFLLLAAACFAKSSPRFYHWLLNNRLFGAYIKNYLEKKGIPKKVKASTILLLWITIICSAIFVVHALWIRLILLSIAMGVSIHILSIRASNQEAVADTSYSHKDRQEIAECED